MGDCVCPHEVCSIHGDNTKRSRMAAAGPWPLAADAQADPPAPPGERWADALDVASLYADEDSRIGIVSRALLGTRSDRPELFGLLIRPSHWLEDTCAIQRNAYGLEPEGVGYVKEQAFAAIIELAELVQALPWKAARDGTDAYPDPTEQQLGHARGELVDLLIFAGNVAVALGFDDRTVWQEVNQKAMKNVTKREGLGKEVWR